MESLPPKIPDYISEKSHLTLRLKPKGVGEVDKKSVGRKDNAGQNKFFESASYEKHSVTFVDKTRKKSDTYDYPDFVATDEFDNAKVYDEIVKPKMPLFMDGYSMHFIAYGQTGSGKSHTMIGPYGTFSKRNDSDTGFDDNFGLFPRAALTILEGIQARSNKSIMTICVAESPFNAPVDLVTKQMINMNSTTNQLEGMGETIIRTP